jgi:hypothetical protein
VGRERVERDIGDDAEFGDGLLDRPDRALGQALGVPGLATV